MENMMIKYLFRTFFLIVFLVGTSFAQADDQLTSGGTNFLEQLPAKNIYLDNNGTCGGGNGSIENLYGSFSEIPWPQITAWIAEGFRVNINLKRGVTWREQLTIGASGVSGRHITIQPYGVGDAPKIDGANIMTGFTNSGGGGCNSEGGVWQKTGVSQRARLVYYGSTRLKYSNDATPKVNEFHWASNILYINVGEDPARGTVHVGQRSKCIHINNYSYITIDGLALYYSNATWEGALLAEGGGTDFELKNLEIVGGYRGILFKNANNVKIIGCNIRGMSNGGIRFISNDINNNVDIFDNVIDGIRGPTGGNAIFLENISDVNIYNNEISNCLGCGIIWGGTYAGECGSYNGSHYEIANANIYNNYIHDLGENGSDVAGIQIGGVPDFTAVNVDIYNNKIVNILAKLGDCYGIDLDIGSEGKVHENYIENSRESGISQINEAGPCSFYNNVIVHCGYGGSTAHGGIIEGSRAINNLWYNNTIYDCYNGIYQANSSTGSTFKNNIIINSYNYHVMIRSESGGIYDNNLYYPDGNDQFNYGSYSGLTPTEFNKNFTEYKTASGQDANSFIANPLFTNADAKDFSLQTNSPAENKAEYLVGYGERISPTSTWTDGILLIPDTTTIGAYGASR
jgi:hypothetical protein